MLETAHVLASVSAALLVAAVAAWVKLIRGPGLRRLGSGAASNLGKVEIASQLLVLAVALSAVAAILAIGGRIAS